MLQKQLFAQAPSADYKSDWSRSISIISDPLSFPMLRQLLISFAVFSAAFACEASESEGPCDGSTLLCSTQVCDTTAGQCCPATTASATATSSSTVDSSSSSSSTVTSTSTTSCADRINQATGVSDCTALSYLCNDSTYYTVMTEQCPKTCGRCSSSSSSSSTSCVDRINNATGVSDCPARASLCNDSTYYTLMTQQCPKTCGRCSSSSSNSSSTSCADRINNATGVSDCPARAALCNNSVYYDVMTQQCPRTCGRCSSSSSTVTATSSSSTTASSTCADKVNNATGISDCPNRRAYCTHSAYISLMRTQCPLTCGFCTSG